jgi:hypothetical protein
VTARERDLQPAPGLVLPAHLAQVRYHAVRQRPWNGRPWLRLIVAGRLDAGRRRNAAPGSYGPHELDGLCQRPHANEVDAVDESGLVECVQRHDDASHATPQQRGRHRQDAGHDTDFPTQRQLAHECQAPAPWSHLLRAEQDPDRYREIERRAGLAQVSRCEVDRDAARRVDEARVPKGATDAFPRLLQRDVGEAHDRESRQSRRNVDLDANDAAVEPVERCRKDGREHEATLAGGAHL